MMKKKLYEKPSVEVVKVQVQNQLLEGSGDQGTTGTQNYQVNDEVKE